MGLEQVIEQALRNNLDIRTVGDLMQRTEAELLASKNFGQTSLNEVRRKLDALGLTLRRK